MCKQKNPSPTATSTNILIAPLSHPSFRIQYSLVVTHTGNYYHTHSRSQYLETIMQISTRLIKGGYTLFIPHSAIDFV